MRIAEFRAKSEEELNQELLALLREQFNLRSQKNGTDENKTKPHNFKRVRRDIARIRTILNEKAREKK